MKILSYTIKKGGKSMKIKSYEYFHLEDITAEYNSIKFD